MNVRKEIRLFDNPSSALLALYGVLLLFLPKINLLSIGDKQTAGIRIDDIILLLFFVAVFWAHIAKRHMISAIEGRVFVFTAFCLFSLLLNKLFIMEGDLTAPANIFYCLRLLEYFLFFYVGILSIRLFNSSSIIKAFFIWNLALIFLQKYGIIGKFAATGYSVDRGRVNGIASFPSEAGALINILFCYLLFNPKPWNFRIALPLGLRLFIERCWPYFLFFLCGVMIIFTGSRIAIVALVIPFLAFVIKNRKKGITFWLLFGLFMLVTAMMFAMLIQQAKALSDRSSGLLSIENIDLIYTAWGETNIEEELQAKSTFDAEDKYDMSWWLRIYKWCFAIKTYVMHPECYLQGIGPGFASAALDGGWLRILTECGIIGSILFCRIFFKIGQQSFQLRWMCIALAINMVFFDVYFAYKLMSMLFFVSGCTYATAWDEVGQGYRIDEQQQRKST